MNAPITYIEDYLNNAYAWSVYEQLRTELSWERRDTAPRYEYWTNRFDRAYTYGHGMGQRTYESQPNHQEIANIGLMLWMTQYEMIHRPPEGCFLNMYEDGTDALGWHSDDDPGIDHTQPISVITLGQSRRIEFRGRDEKGHAPGIELKHGSLLIMHAGMQDTHVHRIPKIHEEIGPRISLTYRSLIP